MFKKTSVCASCVQDIAEVGRLAFFVTEDGDPYPYADDVVLIVDCTEFGVASAPPVVIRQVMFSSYKNKR
jgi:hypothetical protein